MEPMISPQAVSLAELPTGACAVVRVLRGGRELTGRLTALGLVQGSRLEVLQNRGRGAILISVRDSRIALGRGEAAKIWVEVCR
jgi:ferrous iron transport protein A